MFTIILATTDKVTVRDTTVLTAKRIADQSNAKLHVLHVLESASTKNRNIIKHYQSEEEMATSPAYEETIKEEILNSYAGLLDSDGNSIITIVPGFPWHEILRYSRNISADLIVMGPHSTRAQDKKVIRVAGKIGSSVEEVIMREKCPVMIVSETFSKKRLEFGSIVVGIDFSKSCECALTFAVKLAQTYNAKIFIFHMIPVPPYPKYSEADYEADVKTSTRRLQQFSQQIIEGMDHEYCIWGGALPHSEILKCAQQKDADLIVLGSHTKESEGKWYAGSAVERVAFRAECPVIVLTDPFALTPWKDTLKVDAIGDPDAHRTIHVFNKKQEKQ